MDEIRNRLGVAYKVTRSALQPEARKGIASALYHLIEGELGRPLEPSPDQVKARRFGSRR
jgi:hypothetical protein